MIRCRSDISHCPTTFNGPQISNGLGRRCDQDRGTVELLTFCLARISFSQKLKISVYTLEALGMLVMMFINQGKWPKTAKTLICS